MAKPRSKLGKIKESSQKLQKKKAKSTSKTSEETLEDINESSQKLADPKSTIGMDPNLITIEDKAIELLDELLNKMKPYTPMDMASAASKIGFNPENDPTLNVWINIFINELVELMNKYSLKHTYTNGNFYIFNTQFWVRIEDQQMLYFLRDLGSKMGGPKYMVGDVKYAESAYKQLKHQGLYIRNTQKNDELLLNLQNGTLHIAHDDIDVGKFNHEEFLRYQLPFSYERKSMNHEWLDFLEEVLPDEKSRKTLQQALGYLLIRGLKIEKIILLYGSGANGKSVIFEVLSGLLGEDSFSNYSLNALTGSAYYISQLKDKIINYSPDIDLSKINAGKMKILASGEPIECKVPNKEPFIMKNYAKMIFNLNSIKNAKLEDTDGFYRRLLFIPFNVTIPDEKQDKRLAEKLLRNKAGILNWLLEGAQAVIAHEEIFESAESQDFKAKLREKANSIETFIEEYDIENDSSCAIQSSTLYQLYQGMCKEKNLTSHSQTKFSLDMSRKYGLIKDRKQEYVVWNIRMNTEVEETIQTLHSIHEL